MKKKYRKQRIIYWYVILTALLFLVSLVSIFEGKSFAAHTGNLENKKKLTISRGEFVEFLANVKKLPLPKEKRCFRDVPKKSPICSVKEKGFLKGIKGITQNQFRPKTPLSFEELLILTCRAEGWASRFNECLEKVKTKKLTRAFGRKLPSRRETVKRKEVIQFLEKAISVETAEEEKSEEEIETESVAVESPETETLESSGEVLALERTPVEPFTPVTENLVSKGFFGTVDLTQDFPNIFYKNELYFFEGEILSGNYEEIFAFLLPEQNIPGISTINYTASVKNQRFKIPIIFRRPGNFKLGIIPGNSGKSKVIDISVLEALPSPANLRGVPELKKKTLAWRYQEGETRFSWENREGSFVRLTFSQGDEKISYFSRTLLSSITIDPLDFKKMRRGRGEGVVEFAYGERFPFSLQSPWIASEKLSLTFDTLGFYKVEDAMTVETIDEYLGEPGTFQFKGKASIALSNEGAYTLPSGEVRTFQLDASSKEKEIPPSMNVEVNLPFTERGIYIFEINNPEGGAVVNVPIAVGVTPLLPDFFTRNPGELDEAPLSDKEKARKEMLDLINEARRKRGVNPVTLDTGGLTNAAQSHTADMVRRNFFGHVNPDGKGPQDRAIAFEVDTLVKENLAKGPSLPYAFEGLMRSPIHRKNIQEAKWTRVGIGVTKNSEGYYFIAQKFSTNSLTEEDLTRLEENLIVKANLMREAKGLSFFQRHNILMSQAKEWSRKMASQKFFGFQSPDGLSLLQSVRNAGFRAAIQGHLIESQEFERIEAEFQEQPPIGDSRFRTIGLGIAKDERGILKVTVIYNE